MRRFGAADVIAAYPRDSEALFIRLHSRKGAENIGEALDALDKEHKGTLPMTEKIRELKSSLRLPEKSDVLVR